MAAKRERVMLNTMRFRVTGTNHSTGARMSLEFEASAKAAAEHKARGQGMDVQHVQEITDGPAVERHGSSRRGEGYGQATGAHLVGKSLIILAIVATAVWFGWPYLRGLIGR